LFTKREWEQAESWLDASGLALYLLRHLESCGADNTIDANVLVRLRRKRESNKMRVTDMLEELVSLNRAFRTGGICYANVKGFTLAPHACDPASRHQSDFDFLVDPVNLARCRTILEGHGYVLTASTRTLEFKLPCIQRPTLDGQYRAKQSRAVELRIAIDNPERVNSQIRDERLDRTVEWQCGEEWFPALCPVDQLVGQALHLLSHLRNEHTRPSWLLEYRRHVATRRDDVLFWRKVRQSAARNWNG